MIPNSDPVRIRTAYEKVCQTLLEHQTPDGHWNGRLSESALSTAVTVSAFAVFRKAVRSGSQHHLTAEEFQTLETLLQQSTDWLVAHQNPDGGWGDTDKSLSNVSTTVLVKSALTLTESPTNVGECIAELAAVQTRYGSDQTFAVPILTNAALAGLVDWKDIPQLPFELAALPMSWFRFVKLNVVSYAVPALVAVGQVRFYHLQNKKTPIRNFFRRLAKQRTLQLIEKMQPASGGYLEAAPLTAFVAMSLSAMGLTDHPIVTKGLRFLLQTVRPNGSWSIDTNLATWLTSLSVSALQGCPPREPRTVSPIPQETLDWLVSCQHQQRHPFTGAQPGGWGWTNLSGAVPDADDTAAALLALSTCKQNQDNTEAVIAGIRWLLNLQNRDGGIPTFCRGWGMLPFDQSSTDITAHALRALRSACERGGVRSPVNCRIASPKTGGLTPPRSCTLTRRIHRAEKKMHAFLQRTQQPAGSWFPLWFGNQFMPDDVNPFYGTAKVLLALAEVDKNSEMVQKGLRYLMTNQNSDGGWGCKTSSVEETAVVVETLSMFVNQNNTEPSTEVVGFFKSYRAGLNWLLEAVESDRYKESSPIGLYFAKLWYYEDLYPIIFTASALRRAAQTEPLSSECE